MRMSRLRRIGGFACNQALFGLHVFLHSHYPVRRFLLRNLSELRRRYESFKREWQSFRAESRHRDFSWGFAYHTKQRGARLPVLRRANNHEPEFLLSLRSKTVAEKAEVDLSYMENLTGFTREKIIGRKKFFRNPHHVSGALYFEVIR